MKIENITTAGSGVMGSQVAWQLALHGKKVTVYDPFEESLQRSQQFHREFAEMYIAERGKTQDEMTMALENLQYSSDLADAVNSADLIIESVPEDLSIKQKFWQEAALLSPEHTIYATNTSSLLPSQIAPFVDKSEKFLTLHFAVPVWDSPIGEIMLQEGGENFSATDPKYMTVLYDFAKSVGLVPTLIEKENPGYLINAMLIPFLISSMDLVRRGISSVEDIDKTWMICNQSKIGPLMWTDMIGMNAAYHISKSWGETYQDNTAKQLAEWIKTEFVDSNKLGVATGQGFYSYPNPSFERADFLS